MSNHHSGSHRPFLCNSQPTLYIAAFTPQYEFLSEPRSMLDTPAQIAPSGPKTTPAR